MAVLPRQKRLPTVLCNSTKEMGRGVRLSGMLHLNFGIARYVTRPISHRDLPPVETTRSSAAPTFKIQSQWNNSSSIQHNAVPSNLTERDQESEKISELYLHKGARDAQRFAPAVPGSLSPAVSVQLHRPGRQAAKRLSESSIEEKAARTGRDKTQPAV